MWKTPAAHVVHCRPIPAIEWAATVYDCRDARVGERDSRNGRRDVRNGRRDARNPWRVSLIARSDTVHIRSPTPMERRVTAEALHAARDARPSTVIDLCATGARRTGTVIDRRLTAGMRRVTTTTWRDAVGDANDTVSNLRDAGEHGDDAGAGLRLTMKSPRSTDEAFRGDVEALTTRSYPHRRYTQSWQRTSRPLTRFSRLWT